MAKNGQGLWGSLVNGCAESEVSLECGASVKFPDAGSQSVCDPLWS